MTDGIPDNAIGYRIAAIVPCDECQGSGDEYEDSMSVVGIPGGWLPVGPCHECDGTGTRVVVTDVAVERTTVEVGVYDLAVWREVPDA